MKGAPLAGVLKTGISPDSWNARTQVQVRASVIGLPTKGRGAERKRDF